MNIRVGKVGEMNNKRKGEDARDFRSKKKTDRSGNWGHSTSKQGSQQSDPWAERLAPAAMQKERGVEYTVSMAIPSSFLNSAQTRELKTYLVSQIARAAVLHEVDEIVVFIDTAAEAASDDADRTPSMFLCRLLQYLECPAYLRKAFFPVHGDLALAGIMPQLDTPHHMRRENVAMFREGVVVEDKVAKDGCYANVGLQREAFMPMRIRPGTRVTVKIDDPELAPEAASSGDTSFQISGTPVAPNTPRAKHGIYWGYKVRLAKSLHEIFTNCPYKDGGYDFMIGQSDKGKSLDEVDVKDLSTKRDEGADQNSMSARKHVLIVFGGGGGRTIESCVDADETLPIHGKDADTLFDLWVNTVPQHGSKQVRTEEAVMMGLTALRPVVLSATAPKYLQ